MNFHAGLTPSGALTGLDVPPFMEAPFKEGV
jgi:hypothetical protein